MHPLLVSLLRLIYPLPETRLQRDRPLEVLALGLSRCGTESLRNALIDLGDNDVYHGFRFILKGDETIPWLRLAHAQARAQSLSQETEQQVALPGLTAQDFDTVIGDCSAVTDQPSCGFAHELLSAFPDAKVILNHRFDIEAWHESVLNTVEKFNEGWYDWLLTLFHAELFGQQRCFFWLLRNRFGGRGSGDFERYGRKWYRDHCSGLRKRLEAEGREFLWWKVEDGWKPLCSFLGLEPPDKPFPNGNTAADFEAKMGGMFVRRRAEAERNLRVVSVTFATLVAARMAWYIWL